MSGLSSTPLTFQAIRRRQLQPRTVLPPCSATAKGALSRRHLSSLNRIVCSEESTGAFYGAPLLADASIKQAFAIFSSSIHNFSVSPSWPVIWSHLEGDQWQIQLNNSEHATYGDFPFLADLWGIREKTHGLVDELVGAIPGQEAIDVIGNLTKAFVFGKEPVGNVVANAKEDEKVWRVQNVTVS
ncbi:hypothetical protein CLAIMM_13577 [Cladophialophora immunda]|nr:hypothetical protein CLAIMM_13577 [Cladophialophora immunda]